MDNAHQDLPTVHVKYERVFMASISTILNRPKCNADGQMDIAISVDQSLIHNPAKN